jgi:hypothetical protein
MGPIDFSVAVELAAAHHNHLPWRHYLAPFAVLAFLFLDRYAPYMGNQYLYFCTGAMLTICVVPRPATVKRWVRFLSIDLVAKSQWVQRQPLRAAVVSGGASGLAAGLLFGALPAIGQFVYSSGWYDLFVPTALWPVLSRLSWLILFAPLLPWLLGLALARRRVKADPVVTGVISALAFPLGSHPVYYGCGAAQRPSSGSLAPYTLRSRWSQWGGSPEPSVGSSPRSGKRDRAAPGLGQRGSFCWEMLQGRPSSPYTASSRATSSNCSWN